MQEQETVEIDFGRAVQHLIAEGDHKAITDRVDMRQAKDSAEGGKYINWQFRLVDAPYENRCAFLKTSLKDNAVWKLRALLKALGLPASGKITFDPRQVVGRPIVITIAHREFNGELQEEVTDFRAA